MFTQNCACMLHSVQRGSVFTIQCIFIVPWLYHSHETQLLSLMWLEDIWITPASFYLTFMDLKWLYSNGHIYWTTAAGWGIIKSLLIWFLNKKRLIVLSFPLRMQAVGLALEELLVTAQKQDCLTVGIYESAKLLNTWVETIKSGFTMPVIF